MQTYRNPVALLVILCMSACNTEVKKEESVTAPSPIVGTWELLSETKIEKGDTTFTPAAATQRMIKILNGTHFSFLRHDLTQGKDSTTASFVAGGGSYTLKDSLYTENLEYCIARDWENHTFNFVVEIKEDTLIQTGVEKLEGLGVDRIIVEKYARVK